MEVNAPHDNPNAHRLPKGYRLEFEVIYGG